ncbi:MAG: hypothetical protein ACC742_17140 [Thermoanaerobaculales bacterium]
MKRESIASAAVILIGLVALLALTVPAEAGKRYTVRDLRGTYFYTMTEVRDKSGNPGVVEHCSGYGKIEFYGNGTSLIEGWDRCGSAGVPNPDSQPHGYSVAPDGEVILWRTVDPANTVHCQILANGRMLMCDGVESTPDVHSFHATAVKQN